MSAEGRAGRSVASGFLRGVVLGRWMLAAVLSLGAATASAAPDSQMSAMAIKWANANIANFNKYVQYARHGPEPQVPVPPMVDPPCHVCGDTTQTQGEAQVAAWVARSQEPEATYIAGLAAMDKQIQIFNASGSDLSPASEKALAQFESDDAFFADMGLLAGRVLNGKAIPMAKQYDREPKRAYAGILFLLAASKLEQTLVSHQDYSGENQVLQLAATWEQSIADKINNDVISGHQYNLCPVYSSIFRSVELLGGSETDINKFEETLQKLQNLVKFNVNVNLKANIDATDGGYMHAAWTGTAHLTLKLDTANSCYTPLFDNGGKMAVNVTNWDAVNVDTKPDGSKETIPVSLTSPHSYNVNLGVPQLNLCDPQPIFQMPLPSSNVPPEEIEAKGHREKATLFGAFMVAVVAPNEINSAKTNEVTGTTPTLPGGNAPSSQDPNSQAQAQAQAAIEAHKGDVNWLMSPAGQAAIAQIQKAALLTAQTKMASAGMVVPTASSFTQLGESLGSAHLPWTNGQTQPVNKTLHMQKDTTDIELRVSVQQSQ